MKITKGHACVTSELRSCGGASKVLERLTAVGLPGIEEVGTECASGTAVSGLGHRPNGILDTRILRKTGGNWDNCVGDCIVSWEAPVEGRAAGAGKIILFPSFRRVTASETHFASMVSACL